MINGAELNITGVQISEYRSGIPLKGWSSLESALKTFASGRSRESSKTQNDLIRNMPGGGMGTAYFVLATAGIDRNEFVEEMLTTAKSTFNSGYGFWRKSYEYDAMGTRFFKTSVDIRKLPDTEDGYLLGLNAAYVGKAVEDELAKVLEVDQGLQWKTVNIGLEPAGTNFRVDFNAVAERLQSPYEELDPSPTPEPRGFIQKLVEVVKKNQLTQKPVLTGEAIIRTLLATDEYTSGQNPFVLGIKDGVEVSLNLGRVGNRFNWKNGNKSEELWKTEGAVLSGPLAESYSDNHHPEAPSLGVYIRPFSVDKYNLLPAINPKMKANMNDLAVKIAAAFQPVIHML